MKKKVSLKNIAEKVGVSTTLVSYVLNNQMVGRISKEIALKIKEAAKELNYRTNHIAKSLKTNKTYTIGLIVADISNSFSSTLAQIIQDEAEKSNYTVLFGSSHESAEKSDKLLNILLDRQVDGFIIAPVEHAAGQILYLQQNDVPFVLIDRYFPGVSCNYVAIDNYKAAYEAVIHLAAAGNRRIGMITYHTSLFHIMERKRGYCAALKENNLDVENNYIKEVSITDTKEDVEKAIDALLSLPQPADAILFANNTISTFGLKYINILPVTVPDDLAIISFDESDAAELFYAPLTHIRQPLLQMGQAATQLLLEAIGGDPKVTGVIMEADLIIGQSTKTKSSILYK